MLFFVQQRAMLHKKNLSEESLKWQTYFQLINHKILGETFEILVEFSLFYRDV